MVAAVSEFFFTEDGATAIEYGLLAALVVLALMVGLREYAAQTIELYGDIENAVNEVMGS